MIRQLSVFVENEPGSMMRVTSVLTESHINIRAISTFDTPEFGIMRLVVDEPECAKESLTAKGFVTRITEVVGAELKDERQPEQDAYDPCRWRDQCKLYLFVCDPRGKSTGDRIPYG